MQDYELDPDQIINWATDYASYEELERVSKALYGIYAVWRKRDYPKVHQAAKAQRKQFRNQNQNKKLRQL